MIGCDVSAGTVYRANSLNRSTHAAVRDVWGTSAGNRQREGIHQQAMPSRDLSRAIGLVTKGREA